MALQEDSYLEEAPSLTLGSIDLKHVSLALFALQAIKKMEDIPEIKKILFENTGVKPVFLCTDGSVPGYKLHGSL